ncbi:hypothetical protein K474DRAFT_1777216 [Panus rudis PR-1116 ss-1]|nr:hypothetical protein K474DRAFT_1777216 [Panus rudis PR-1116 ss-1]
MSTEDGPPWFAKNPDTGRIDILNIPEQLKSHPEILRRGLALREPAKPGVVFTTTVAEKPCYVVKVLKLDSEERSIYEYLQQHDLASPNHTIPFELSTLGHPLLIMPFVSWISGLRPATKDGWTSYELLSIFLQLTEGIEFLHRHNIAHMDYCYSNTLIAEHGDVVNDKRLVEGKLYIIDFDWSKRLKYGPGVQHAITLTPTQIEPPNGLKHFDPYAWDVYCLGHVCQDIIRISCEERAPWVAHWYASWLMGKERGCTGVCRCRPTARHARRVLEVLRSFAYVLNVCWGWTLPIRWMLGCITTACGPVARNQ